MKQARNRADASQRPRVCDRRDGRRSGLDGRAGARVERRAGRVHVVDQQHRLRRLFQRGDVDPARRPAGLPARARLAPGVVAAGERRAQRQPRGGWRGSRPRPRRGRSRARGGGAAAAARGRRPRRAARRGASPQSGRPSRRRPEARRGTSAPGRARARTLRRPSGAHERANAAPPAGQPQRLMPRQAAARAAPPAQPRERAQAGSAQQLVRRAQRLPAGDARRRRDDREQLGEPAPRHGTRPRREPTTPVDTMPGRLTVRDPGGPVEGPGLFRLS